MVMFYNRQSFSRYREYYATIVSTLFGKLSKVFRLVGVACVFVGVFAVVFRYGANVLSGGNVLMSCADCDG